MSRLFEMRLKKKKYLYTHHSDGTESDMTLTMYRMHVNSLMAKLNIRILRPTIHKVISMQLSIILTYESVYSQMKFKYDIEFKQVFRKL